MAHTHHAHTHGHPHGTPGHDQPDAGSMATLLDLDAAVTGHYLDDVADRIEGLSPRPARIIDLGSGTGTGTLALARRFPTAEVVALDNSTDLLERVAAAASRDGIADRVRTVTADLDSALPAEVCDVDVAWASSTMHHFADPGALLSSTFAAMRPGGVLAVVEIDELPTFLPAGTAEGEVERRLRATANARHWNAHPDWSSTIAAAGFDLVDTADIVTHIDNPPGTSRDYAAFWIGRARDGLADEIPDDDRAVLDRLLGDGPTSLAARDDLVVQARRVAWLARRPA
ncbi:class I SAM-dependent methyltransferase [Gordonia sp. ABSL11-1]|uniref:class I SAM-dependent methyltransferase n=1 Tax=Gordonia sp. ABSL11-1 TaxID=3053924 RepID=UPI002573914E|nr:class I SAM-dependent methyltransferase [Gordonia sp. ABSL11-1]MDL9945410.1 class I SAM-dependent methyltransferase [Gordonia sp. ABSL11-1]